MRRIRIVFVVLLASAISSFVTFLVLHGRDARCSIAVASSRDTAASNSILSCSELYAEAARTHYGSGEFLLSAQSYGRQRRSTQRTLDIITMPDIVTGVAKTMTVR